MFFGKETQKIKKPTSRWVSRCFLRFLGGFFERVFNINPGESGCLCDKGCPAESVAVGNWLSA